MRGIVSMAAVALLLAASSAAAQRTATARLMNPAGEEVGWAELTETPGHGVLVRVRINRLAPGAHGFHIHAVGACEAPDFSSAGGHFAPRGHAHGLMHPDGKHAGDLRNLYVPENGMVMTEQLAMEVTLEPAAAGSLFDEDGSSLVIHQNPDDYASQPSGGGGPKLACGVIR